MGAGLAKNKLSPETKRTHRGGGVISVAPTPPPTISASSSSKHPNIVEQHEGLEDEFLEKIAKDYYSRRDRRSIIPGGTTYAGVDLRLEVDCVDTPAMEEEEEPYIDEGEVLQSTASEPTHIEYEDDGYYTAAEKVLYEKPKPKPDNTQLIVNWKKGTLLGSGGFGKVYLGLDNETGAMFAVKEISLGGDSYQQSKELKSFKQEVALMKNLRHENIVQYLGTMEEGNELNIFLEYVPGGSIAFILSKFGSFSEALVKRYTRQILLGLEYLHSHHIIHRDIKGANILVDNQGVVKLADFGASKKMEALMTTTGGYNSLKGTPYWMAPEVIKQSGHGRQADIWSVGCTVIEMATGKPPFHEFTDQISVLFHIATSNSPPPIPSHLSPVAQDFLLKCFERNPMNRPNARGLLEHPFLKEEGRKLSGNNGFGSPKVSHSFNSPRAKDSQQPVFAKQEEPRQPSPLMQGSPQIQSRPLVPAQSIQADDDNLIEEPTWSWGGDKRKLNFAEKFSAGEHHHTPSFAMPAAKSRSGELNSIAPSSSFSRGHNDDVGDFRRHKRAISVTPEKMIPSTPLPLDANAPPPARLSMRRHSALESSVRDASEYFKAKEAAGQNGLGNSGNNAYHHHGNNQHSNGLHSSPSTPGRGTRGDVESNVMNSMASFNTSFNQNFNSVNNTHFNINNNNNNNNSSQHLPRKNSSTSVVNAPNSGKRFSPSTPRKEVVDEEDINKFLKTTSNDFMQSTKDLSKFKQVDVKRSFQTVDKLPQERDRKLPQLSPKKFSDGLIMDGGFSEEASSAKFKKKAPGTTTTTVLLNTNVINNNNNSNERGHHRGDSNGGGPSANLRESRDGSRDGNRDGLTRSNGGVRNACDLLVTPPTIKKFGCLLKAFYWFRQIWMMGKKYEQETTEVNGVSSVTFSSFLERYNQMLWFSYRKDFPVIEDSFDAGWGCMLRSGQMMLAQALVNHRLGKGWQIPKGETPPADIYEIIKLFSDNPTHPFSIHSIARVGQKYGKTIGEWFAPTSISLSLADLVNEHHPDGFKLMVSEDGALYRDKIEAACSKHKSKKDKEKGKEKEQDKEKEKDKETTITKEEEEEQQQWRDIVVMVPLRLGLDSTNSVYYPPLLELFQFPQSLGIVGGKPRASLYFIAAQDDYVFYLDPHVVQPTVNTDEEFPIDSFHTTCTRKVHVSEIDPSLVLAFHCSGKADFEDLVKRITELNEKHKEATLFTILNKAPDYNENEGCLVLNDDEDADEIEFDMDDMVVL